MTGATDSGLRFAASSGQGALLAKRTAGRACTLVCLLNYADQADHWKFAAAVASAVSGLGGSIRWQGRVHQPLNNAVFDWREAVLIDLPDGRVWPQLQADARWRQAQDLLAALEIRVGLMPPLLARILAVLGGLFRMLPLSSAASEKSVASQCLGDLDPIEARYNAMRARDSGQPIVIMNFHKFRERSAYPDDAPESHKGLSGQQAYLRYGRRAVRVILGRGNRPVFVGTYLLTLVGNDGEASPDLYDDITLMQYLSGPEFAACFELRVMDGAADHRRAGLAHCMFAVTEPDAQFILR